MQEERAMGVIIIREMVGSSPESWSAAAADAVSRASQTVRNIRQVDVVRHSARVEQGRIVEFQVQLKIHFEYEGG
jgi:dodecin